MGEPDHRPPLTTSAPSSKSSNQKNCEEFHRPFFCLVADSMIFFHLYDFSLYIFRLGWPMGGSVPRGMCGVVITTVYNLNLSTYSYLIFVTEAVYCQKVLLNGPSVLPEYSPSIIVSHQSSTLCYYFLSNGIYTTKYSLKRILKDDQKKSGHKEWPNH